MGGPEADARDALTITKTRTSKSADIASAEIAMSPS